MLRLPSAVQLVICAANDVTDVSLTTGLTKTIGEQRLDTSEAEPLQQSCNVTRVSVSRKDSDRSTHMTMPMQRGKEDSTVPSMVGEAKPGVAVGFAANHT